MLLILEALIPTFFLVGLGLYARRSGLVPEEQWAGLESLSYWLFFPALIFYSIIKADLKNVPLGAMTFTLVGTVITMAVILLLLYPFFKSFMSMDGPSYSSIYQSVLRWNGFIALAIVQKAHGIDAMALVAVAMAAMIPIINVIVVAMMSVFASEGRVNFTALILNIAKNPFIWSSVGGLLVNIFDIPLWGPIESTIDVTSRAGLATGLLIVGAGLKLRYAFPPSREIWVGSLLRLFGMPALAIAFAMLFGLTGNALEVVIICTAVPTAMNAYVLAKKMGGDAPLVAAIVTLQTALSAFTIPLLLMLVRAAGL